MQQEKIIFYSIAEGGQNKKSSPGWWNRGAGKMQSLSF